MSSQEQGPAKTTHCSQAHEQRSLPTINDAGVVSDSSTLRPLPAPLCEWEKLAKAAKFNARQMAGLCGGSDRQLQRLFKAQLGLPPGRWLMYLRCRLAKELIAQGYSSKAVAAELHYASASHLCHQFKKVFGVSPQAFAPNRAAYRSLEHLVSAEVGQKADEPRPGAL